MRNSGLFLNLISSKICHYKTPRFNKTSTHEDRLNNTIKLDFKAFNKMTCFGTTILLERYFISIRLINSSCFITWRQSTQPESKTCLGAFLSLSVCSYKYMMIRIVNTVVG